MAVKKLEASTIYHNAGDILVYNEVNPAGGIKVLKQVWVDEVEDYRYVVQYGSVKTGEWVGDKLSTGGPEIALYSGKEVSNGYGHKWTPDPKLDIKPGDVLMDQDGAIYLVKSLDQVWHLKRGVYGSLRYWTKTPSQGYVSANQGRIFTQVKTAAGKDFSTELKFK